MYVLKYLDVAWRISNRKAIRDWKKPIIGIYLRSNFVEELNLSTMRHSQEPASLGYSNSNGKENNNLDTSVIKTIAGVSITTQGDTSKPSRSLKKNEKIAQQEAAREQRIQDEQSSIKRDRMIENEMLERKLEAGLIHCLYRAVEDQLAFFSMQ
ncbi:OVARIAN TUMOR DOMAIN-containing deubiquitinating enzyme 5-like [Macadamia integrifolia]|uniref:OVARIAN TUMOR DOMAIN-containing deubiquitinating enzyme 5-like n=1 Tax=Macadamia integrifolia TaxID=60698 RepID=UPI001C5005B3|nr:OVARIAN TUMOR DOMAIN-containing deubiquitinating enzyme 5-like [Macadamia integrifolia]